MRDRCPKTRRGKQCRRALHFDGLHIYTPARGRGRKREREDGDLAEFRRLLEERAEGWCEATRLVSFLDGPARYDICGTYILHHGMDAHHLWPEDRDRGTHDPSRGLWLCRNAHEYIHSNPRLARSYGLLRPDAA